MTLDLILRAISAGGALIPEVADLIQHLKGDLGETDQAAIDQALAESTAAAAAQHEAAQNL